MGSAKALPVLMCAKSKCGLQVDLKQVATTSMPDCSQSACPSKCSCVEQQCASSVQACLADAQCAAGQTCIDKCACGDTACAMNCVKSSPSAKALPVLMCAK